MGGNTVDLAVIGSGGAGFAAAIRARQQGLSVLMVERGTLGGTCVNVGCIPSKALLAAAQARHHAFNIGRFPGLAAAPGRVDLAALVGAKDDLVDSLRTEKYSDVATSHDWTVLTGEASFTGTPDAPHLHVAHAGRTDDVDAAQYLVATGSRPWAPPIAGLDQIDYLTSTTAMDLTEVPASLLVLGGGYVALEQAQLFARLGSKVTLLVRSRLLSKEEPEVSRTLEQAFAVEAINVVSRADILQVSVDIFTGRVVATASLAGRTVEFTAEKLLVATGRRPVTDGLNLDTVGVATGAQGEIVVDDRIQTANPRVWAAGDVTGHPQFVYVAARHGTLMVDNAFNAADRRVDYRQLPRVTFTSPAVGAVGLTDRQVASAGIRCDCRVLPLASVPRAQVNRDTRGFIKMVAAADTGRILGITAVAHDAGELAAAGSWILRANMTVHDVTDSWAPYLTMAEGIKLTARTFTTDVNSLSCCA